MRRAFILAVAVLLVAALPVQAGTGPSVDGDYVYGGGGSHVVIHASLDGDKATGEYHYTNAAGGYLDGVVKCLVVDGADAWVAGIITDSDTQPWGTWFGARLHDGGTDGDMAITLVNHNDLTRRCEQAASVWTRWMVPVREGGLTIVP